jgi:glycosyltransferase involved in cell wall biosynthesis
MNPTVSIVIRTFNEEKTLEKVLHLIETQTIQPLEIIIVDNESSDKTIEIAKQHKVKIITISKKEFSHPRSCNLGLRIAKGDIVVLTNGHSFPISNKWLEFGIKHFEDSEVAGTFGKTLLDNRASLTEKIINYFYIRTHGYGKIVEYKKINLFSGGLLGTASAAIRRNLWKSHNFDESYLNGGEDTEWAFYWISKGMKIIEDPCFSVYHAHGDSFFRELKRHINYAKTHFRSLKKYYLEFSA